jgi:hypothetical protein
VSVPDFDKPEPPYRDWILALQRHLNATRTPGTKKLRVPDLLALSLNSDPFWAGGVMNSRLAKWFAGVWRGVSIATKKHLRGGHYRQVSIPGKNAEGKTYANTQREWDRFNLASRQARHLQLVDPLTIDDMQNPRPVLPEWVNNIRASEPHVLPPTAPEFALPSISLKDGQIEFDDVPYVVGFDPDDQHDRAHLLSLWVEKSTMNSILEPLCEELGAELVQMTGRASITAACTFLKRLQECGKPGRIFYVSDFDPSGESMPLEVARSIEFYRPILAPDIQVSLTQIALTEAQVKQYGLPKMPTKETDNGAKKFEQRHGGTGMTELDALETLHPGELEKLVRAAFRPYTDRTLPKRLEEAQDLAVDAVREAWQDETEELRDELANARSAIDKTTRKYEARVNALQKEMQRELRPHAKKLKQLEEDFAGVIEDFDVALPERPMPEVTPDETTWLFDSRRGYREQLEHYKQRQT